jgi:hypothetical protein
VLYQDRLGTNRSRVPEKGLVFRRERLGVGPEEPELAAETNLTLSTEPAKANVDTYVWM